MVINANIIVKVNITKPDIHNSKNKFFQSHIDQSLLLETESDVISKIDTHRNISGQTTVSALGTMVSSNLFTSILSPEDKKPVAIEALLKSTTNCFQLAIPFLSLVNTCCNFHLKLSLLEIN